MASQSLADDISEETDHMATFRASDVWELFSYQTEEQQIFPFIAHYMQVACIHRDEIINNDEIARRYMLAGLYLTYRACERQGLSMCSQVSMLGRLHQKRLNAYVELTGDSIESSEHYLWMLGRDGQSGLIHDPGHYLSDFVFSEITSPVSVAVSQAV